ncbi:hypothetical protein A3A25_03565 [Candidatus Azambacteria bacterium RIFCSPLOWO2_01_FULL_46_26]|uniref:Prepilin-type N-terminal cleavage/methylation domain-containing protein n=2 Tax=Candidatus Azamiibacteriota TaxID=1752741 RepID=A0A1F5C5W0_9BACT|nr:MAG: hypothetical protein A2W60_00950 [Candidatus Azambacteria bacterium RIFCSPHIGHO2_02_46_12]OGD38242.1 MAG: hypothetical protein A3A25_03565 [Candidatus Azambacteria bacterium RIFCSPLOWO2_01_FULL_46_26]
MTKHILQNNKGFSLLETVVALGILVVGIGGAVGLVAQSLASIEAIKNKVISANLAQEGIEVVRNLRDENWLNDVHWRGEGGGILLADGDYRVQYNATALTSFTDTFLQTNSSGYYGYNNEYGYLGGSDTVFKRKITISMISDTQIKVISRVDWTEKGRVKFIEIEDRLYNWK